MPAWRWLWIRLLTLRQPKSTLQIEIIPDLFNRLVAHEKALEKTEHHCGHVVTDRIFGLLELFDQRFERLLTLRAILGSRFEGRSHRLDDRDIVSDDLLLLLDFVQTALDASG